LFKRFAGPQMAVSLGVIFDARRIVYGFPLVITIKPDNRVITTDIGKCDLNAKQPTCFS
jgi:hypothetical protein